MAGTCDARDARTLRSARLPVFDGRRRYDLKLTFKRMDQVKADKGYAGPVAVCAVSFQAARRPSRLQHAGEVSVRGPRHRAVARAGRRRARAGAVPRFVASMLGNLVVAGHAASTRRARLRRRSSAYGISTTEPVVLRASTSRCACAASRSG